MEVIIIGLRFEEFPLNVDFYIPNIYSKSVFIDRKVRKKTKVHFGLKPAILILVLSMVVRLFAMLLLI